MYVYQWADQCKSYMVEAKWYYSGYTPTLQEYIENGWISIAIAGLLVHVCFSVTNPITEEAIECLMEYPDIIRHSSTIVRLVNDLGTSSVSTLSYTFILYQTKRKRKRKSWGHVL